MATRKTASNEVEIPRQTMSTEELAGIASFDDALKLLEEKHGKETIATADAEIGDGFKMLDNKDHLVGVGFILVSWDFHQGDHGEFVTAKAVTIDGKKFIINDGSTGIRDQLMSYSAKSGKYAGLVCKKGLRQSRYEYTDPESGQKKPAITYYIDASS